MGMSHYHYKDGKIVDEWTVYDELSLLVQIKLAQLADKLPRWRPPKPERTSRTKRNSPGQSGILPMENEMSKLKLAVSALALVLGAGTAHAGCGIEGGNVKILANDFDALGTVIKEAEACAGDGVTVEANMTTEHKALQVPALTVNPAQYTVAMVANNSIVPLMNDGLIRPLDELVEKYGQQLQPTQLIKVDGKVMAIASWPTARTSTFAATS